MIDQYRVTEDPRTAIRSDPNRDDDPEYIVRLVAQVIRVSLETIRIVNSLPLRLLTTAARRLPDTADRCEARLDLYGSEGKCRDREGRQRIHMQVVP